MEFKLHDENTAPEASKPVLKQAKEKYGFALNLFGVMAESPAALKAYTTLSGILDEDVELDAKEQQIVMLATSEFNSCGYCMAAHSTVAEKMAGVPEDIEQLHQSLGRHASGRSFPVEGLVERRLSPSQRLPCALT